MRLRRLAASLALAGCVAFAQKPSPFPKKNSKATRGPLQTAPPDSRTADNSPNFPGTAKTPPAAPKPAPEKKQEPAKPVPAATQPAPPKPAPEASTVRTASGGEEGLASFFGSSSQGKNSASGERIDTASLTAAHPSLPMGTRLRVTNLANGRTVEVRVVDRCSPKRVVSVSRRAAEELGFAKLGSARVRVEQLQ